MLLIIDMFYIEHHKICIFHQFLYFPEKRFFSRKRISTCIKRCMDSGFLRFAEQFNQEVNLKKRLSSAYRDPAFISPVSAIAQSCFQKIICRIQRSLLMIPCIRVMTELTAHSASCQKDHVSYSRSVYWSKTFKWMNVSFYFVCLFHSGVSFSFYKDL